MTERQDQDRDSLRRQTENLGQAQITVLKTAVVSDHILVGAA